MNIDQLKARLECPICLDIPRSKMFNCVNGHKICEACYGQLHLVARGGKQCPQARCTYDKPPRRLRDLEAVIEISDFNLACRWPGCNVELSVKDLKQHEAKCDHRQVPCPYTKCCKLVQFRDIDSCRVANNHNDKKKLKDNIYKPYFRDEYLRRDHGDWALAVWTSEGGEEFYPQLVQRNGLWYFWVKIKADPKLASRYKFTAKIQSLKKGLTMECTAEVHPVDDGVEKVIASGNYLVMKTENIKKFKVNSKTNPQGFRVNISFIVSRK